MHCKHISISKAFQRAKPKYLPLFSSLECVCETVRVSLPCGCSIAHKHVPDTLLLAIYKWIALKCLKRHVCDIWCVCLRVRTLFFPHLNAIRVVDGTMVVFDLLRRGSAMVQAKHTHSHSFMLDLCMCAYIPKMGAGESNSAAPTNKNSSGRKSERISDMLCNRIHIFCTCGWCVNSLRLQIQVILNASSLPN